MKYIILLFLLASVSVKGQTKSLTTAQNQYTGKQIDSLLSVAKKVIKKNRDSLYTLLTYEDTAMYGEDDSMYEERISPPRWLSKEERNMMNDLMIRQGKPPIYPQLFKYNQTHKPIM